MSGSVPRSAEGDMLRRRVHTKMYRCERSYMPEKCEVEVKVTYEMV
jgi:hypothetical protein